MESKRPKKTHRILYLYMTAPLVLLALILGVVALSTSRSEKTEDAAKAPPKILVNYEACSSKADCLVGESCRDGRCVNLLREGAKRPVSEVKPAKPDDDSSARWAAVMAAIMAGLTGLMGAVAQTITAFMNARERRSR